MRRNHLSLIFAGSLLVLIPLVIAGDGQNITHPKDVLVEGNLTATNVTAEADLEASNIHLGGKESTTGYKGNSAGQKKQEFSLTCPDDGVAVGLDVKRYWEEDGDKDRYTFQLRCK